LPEVAADPGVPPPPFDAPELELEPLPVDAGVEDVLDEPESEPDPDPDPDPDPEPWSDPDPLSDPVPPEDAGASVPDEPARLSVR